MGRLPLVTKSVCLVLLAATGYAAEPKDENPLVPLIRFAEQQLGRIDGQIQDYTCTLLKRERINGRLSSQTHAFVKLRHQQIRDGAVVVPFSVYMRFLSPADVRDREILYVQGRNDGKLIARRGGRRFQSITVAIDPESPLAMRASGYPVTEMGIRNLLKRLIVAGQEELQYGETQVEHFQGATVNGRTCMMIQITHPVRRDHFRYHFARIFIDDELDVPIRYAAYDWPAEEGGQPRLLEEFTFLELQLNVGLKYWDFDHRNESYKFRKGFRP